MSGCTRVVCLFGALLALAGCPQPSDPDRRTYAAQTVLLDAIDPEASALNNLGEIVGTVQGNDDAIRPAIWADGALNYLETADGYYDVATAISPTGGLVGLSLPDDTGEDVFFITYWVYGVRAMRTQPEADRYVYAVSSQLQSVGWTRDDTGQEYPTLWTLTGQFDLPTYDDLGGRAIDINARGQIVGYSRTSESSDYTTAVVWNVSGLSSIGGLGGHHSSANAINDAGVIVGHGGTTVSDDSVHHAWVDEGSGPADLGTLGGARSLARDVNSSQQIVGWSEVSSGAKRAVLWERPASGGSYLAWDLQESLVGSSAGLNLVDALDINDDGQILAVVQQGQQYSYVLLLPAS